MSRHSPIGVAGEEEDEEGSEKSRKKNRYPSEENPRRTISTISSRVHLLKISMVDNRIHCKWIRHHVIISQCCTQLKIHRVVVAVIAILAGHETTARFEASVPALAYDPLARKSAIVVALCNREVVIGAALMGSDRPHEAIETLVARVHQHCPGILCLLVLFFVFGQEFLEL